MKNSFFDISFNTVTGNISSIKNCNDIYDMNWCSKDQEWGRIIWKDNSLAYNENIVLKSFTEDNNRFITEYSNEKISVKIVREFTREGNLTESYIIKNITNTVFCINRDNFGIALPFNDRYTTADECMVRHCHTHIWCGHNIAWINALRMGVSDCNLGLVLTEGAIDCYSQMGCETNMRGTFILHPESILLKSGEEYKISWELFWHKGTEDFKNILNSYSHNIEISATHYTVFKNENLEFKVRAANGKKAEIYLEDTPIYSLFEGGVYKVCLKPEKTGEYRFVIKQGNILTWADFIVKDEFKELLEKRIRFLIRKQQCLDKESPLYGAFLIYDNEIGSQFFNDFWHDHNACRERLNMPFLLLKYLQIKDDNEVREAIRLYIDFLFREFYDESTGEVFNSIGKNRNLIRPYNAPGVMLLLAEMYFVFKEKRYLKNIIRLAEHYYSIGGEKCYSNAVAVEKVLRAFKEAGLTDDYEKMLLLFKKHAKNIINNGTDYPKHEVNYEQTIVTPAVSIVSECGIVTNEKKYANEAEKHIKCLERFSGFQPSFHLNEIAIRYWDDFWFGKNKLFGDTFPHHLSCLTARAYYNYGRLSNDSTWIKKAEECIRNCFCLISDDGRGSAAYVYPYKSNNIRAQFYDPFANDQDLILYDALYLSEYLDTFKI